MPYQSPVDIGNRALQHITQGSISSFTEDSVAAGNINLCYDQLRLAELSRHVWAFAIKRARVRPVRFSTQLWTPPTYNPATTYTVGQVVMYASTAYANAAIYPWICQVPSSIGATPDLSTDWSHFFGVMATDIFDSGASYAAGEVVIQPPAYAGGTTYAKNNIVESVGLFYVSLSAGNVGHTPLTSPTFWSPWVLPSAGSPNVTPPIITAISFNTAPNIYVSLLNDNGPLTQTPVPLPSASAFWTSTAGTLKQLTILWPPGTGPVNQLSTANLYPLPFTWLRPAPEMANDSKHPWLGALQGQIPKDVVYQGKYFTAPGMQSPVGGYDLQFAADIADVTEMHTQFCETLAVRIGKEIDEPITAGANTDKLERAYKQTTGEAMRIDQILQGDPAEEMDQFISVRF